MKKKTGRECTTCRHRDLSSIEGALRRGDPVSSVAPKYGLSRSGLERHRREHMPKAKAPALVVTQTRPADASPLERARLNADEALQALQRGEEAALPSGDLARLRNALTQAEKLYAQLASSRALTPEAIVKTAGWVALVEQLVEVLKPFPDAQRAVVQAFRGEVRR